MNNVDPTTVALYIRLVIFGIFLILLLIFLFRRPKDQKRQETGQPQVENPQTELARGIEKDVLAGLTVLESDDASLKDQVIYVLKYPFTLGRNSSNDFAFPNDLAVSNFHAKLTVSGSKVLISEIIVDAKGQEKAPRYGTFVNGQPLRAQAVELADGDEIRLGSRLCLSFEYVDASGLPGTCDVKMARKR